MFKKIDDSSVTIFQQCKCDCGDACKDSSVRGTKMGGKAGKKP